MSISMYQASVPAFVQMLNNLSAILDKAEAYAKNRKIDPEVLINYRLAADMLPFITVAFVQSARPKEVDGSEDREINLTLGEHTMSFKGQPYLVHFVMPNFYFHCTTAYDILRHCGVELGKRDFIGTI